jgi:RNA polymerase sigma-70 factor, ECF subfamily
MDAAGFEAFYRATAQPVARQVHLMLGDMGEAQHAVHVAYARTWKAWKRLSLRPNPEFWTRATALRIARGRPRRALRAVRGQGRRIPREALVYAARDQAVVEALSRLPVRQRDALVLHHVVGLDVTAVAEVMGSTPDRTQARLDHGRTALAALLPHLLGVPAAARVPAPGTPVASGDPRPEPAAEPAPGTAMAPTPAAAGPSGGVIPPLTRLAVPAPAGGPAGTARPAAVAGSGSGSGDRTATSAEDPLRRYLREAAERQTPRLLPAADVRRRRWRRRYYAIAGATTLVAAGVTGAAMAASATLGDGGEHVPPLAGETTTRPASPSPSGTGSADPRPSTSSPPASPSDPPSDTGTGPASPSPGATEGFSLGRTDARATDVPADRRDLGFVVSRASRDGGTFLAFDRALLRGNGTIENQNQLVRQVPLAEDVAVFGGRRLPPDITVPELIGLIDAGVVRDTPFVLRYDANDQVDEIRELLLPQS